MRITDGFLWGLGRSLASEAMRSSLQANSVNIEQGFRGKKH